MEPSTSAVAKPVKSPRFGEKVKTYLVDCFEKQPYPTTSELQAIADHVASLEPTFSADNLKRLKSWFANQRSSRKASRLSVVIPPVEDIDVETIDARLLQAFGPETFGRLERLYASKQDVDLDELILWSAVLRVSLDELKSYVAAHRALEESKISAQSHDEDGLAEDSDGLEPHLRTPVSPDPTGSPSVKAEPSPVTPPQPLHETPHVSTVDILRLARKHVPPDRYKVFLDDLQQKSSGSVAYAPLISNFVNMHGSTEVPKLDQEGAEKVPEVIRQVPASIISQSATSPPSLIHLLALQCQLPPSPRNPPPSPEEILQLVDQSSKRAIQLLQMIESGKLDLTRPLPRSMQPQDSHH